MNIIKTSVAGTMESSDVQITIYENIKEEIEIQLFSPVEHLFRDEIESVIMSTLKKHSITSAIVKVIDKGALNCTIAARMQVAIYRATGNKNINWEAIN